MVLSVFYPRTKSSTTISFRYPSGRALLASMGK
jgi:hypothetical protein